MRKPKKIQRVNKNSVIDFYFESDKKPPININYQSMLLHTKPELNQQPELIQGIINRIKDL
jgi:hypothetical protein